jgi:DNA processing protein
VPENREVLAVPGNVTSKNSWGPEHQSSDKAPRSRRRGKTFGKNSLQPYDLRRLPQPAMNRRRARLHLYSGKASCPPTRKKDLELLKADEATHIDKIVELLELDVAVRNIRCIVRPGAGGKVKPMPGKNSVKSS